MYVHLKDGWEGELVSWDRRGSEAHMRLFLSRRRRQQKVSSRIVCFGRRPALGVGKQRVVIKLAFDLDNGSTVAYQGGCCIRLVRGHATTDLYHTSRQNSEDDLPTSVVCGPAAQRHFENMGYMEEMERLGKRTLVMPAPSKGERKQRGLMREDSEGDVDHERVEDVDVPPGLDVLTALKV
ncbi:hypothetical protein DEU56DRAFT_760153 [Suillus clintonianus]|uniref:uncharacterized protein n=1 Tax=Suillus clintonianus TaxID=1904413 RepID=UPI001B86D7C6|nr:uncharacterized protein DEU56DRAFT_760153 [Suillus clintonianus]KAG2123071.1 hypothetical protein DEU56DRAFT_760153 [Suillus clintonianus]